MADDLTRFLDDRPVRARRPGIVDRAVKWSRAPSHARLRRGHDAVADARRRAPCCSGRPSGPTADAGDLTRPARRRSSASDRASSIPWARSNRSSGRWRKTRPGRTVDRRNEAGLSSRDCVIATGFRGCSSTTDMLHEVVAKVHRQAGFARMSLGRPRVATDYREAIRIYEGLALEQPDLIWLHTGLIETLHEYSNLLDATADPPRIRRDLLPRGRASPRA